MEQLRYQLPRKLARKHLAMQKLISICNIKPTNYQRILLIQDHEWKIVVVRIYESIHQVKNFE